MRYLVAFVFLFLFPRLLRAQTDSLYIQAFPQEFSIRPYVYKKFTALSTEVNNRDPFSYYPNTPVGLGIGFAYNQYALNLAYAPPMFRDKEKGKTKYLDLQYHYYDRKFVFDLFFQDYKGFYSSYDKAQESYPLYHDIQVIQYGMTGQYLFNNKRFSYRAAFYGNEKQIRSAGSFQLGGGFYYNKLMTENTPILEGRDRFRNYQLSITGGYIYSWIFKKDFFLTIGLTAGINLGLENIKGRGEKVEVTPNLFPRVSMGYNGKDYAIFVNAIVNRVYVTSSDNMHVIFETGRVNLCYVQRLNRTPGILKRIKWLN